MTGCSAGTTASRFDTRQVPSWPSTSTAISQWPSITTPSEATRSRSTNRSRLSGVASAIPVTVVPVAAVVPVAVMPASLSQRASPDIRAGTQIGT